MGTVKGLPIDRLRTDEGLQLRARIDQEHVERLAEAYASDNADNLIPYVQVYYDSKDYWVWDGNHRILGAQRANRKTVRCNVEKGTQRDAILQAAGANHDHGLPRSNADKRHAVQTLLADSQWRKRSDRWIAEACRVSRPLVAEVREAMAEAERKAAAKREMAEIIDRQSDVAELPPQRETRIGKDGKEYAVAAEPEPSLQELLTPKAFDHSRAFQREEQGDYVVGDGLVDDVKEEPKLPADRVAWALDRLGWLWDKYRAAFGDDADWMYFSLAWENFAAIRETQE